MGFECGISLRNRETKKDTELFYLAKLSDKMDNKIKGISEELDDDTRYKLDYYKVEHFVDFLKKFHMLYSMYSDRVQDELEHYLYTNEIMRQGIKDRSDIKNHIVICGMHHELIHFIRRENPDRPLSNEYTHMIYRENYEGGKSFIYHIFKTFVVLRPSLL